MTTDHHLYGTTDIAVRDAAALDARSRVSRLLPKPNDVHTYVLLDPALRRESTPLLFARHTIHQAGDLQVSRVAERFGTKIKIAGPGLPYHCFTLPCAGRMRISMPGANDPVDVEGSRGAIHNGRAGTEAVTADGSTRLNLWIATARLEATLSAVLGESVRTPLAFGPALDWDDGCGPALRRLVLHLTDELERPAGIASNPMALAAFADLFIHSALAGLPHNYTHRLTPEGNTPIPRLLRRAEEYLRAHAAEPLRMEWVAAAAGCSVRTLQLAFRRFRDTTPWAALHQIRLQAARQDLQHGDTSVAIVARRWGFTCNGRFAALYRRRFGEQPSATRRRAMS